jgi:hypothetical protein
MLFSLGTMPLRILRISVRITPDPGGGTVYSVILFSKSAVTGGDQLTLKCNALA